MFPQGVAPQSGPGSPGALRGLVGGVEQLFIQSHLNDLQMWNLFHRILHIADISKQAVTDPPSNIPTLNFAKNAKFRMGHPALSKHSRNRVHQRFPNAYAQRKSIGIRTSGCMLLCTGQVIATLMSFCRCASPSDRGTSMVTAKVPIRRIGLATISLRTTTFMPLKSICIDCAAMPIMVKMHVPRAVATRSVGEKLSPLP